MTVEEAFHFSVPWPQACGYLASALVLATFWMTRMVPLRIVAICSNIAFFTYGMALGLAPVAILHAVLLPVNVWRLWQIRPISTDRFASVAFLPAKAISVTALSLALVGGASSETSDDPIHYSPNRWKAVGDARWHSLGFELLSGQSLMEQPGPIQLPSKAQLAAGRFNPTSNVIDHGEASPPVPEPHLKRLRPRLGVEGPG